MASNYRHVYDLDDSWTDRQIWDYAKSYDHVIVSKDADFSDWVLLSDPPPRVVHVRVGNLRMREFYTAMHRVWPQVSSLINTHKLVIVQSSGMGYGMGYGVRLGLLHKMRRLTSVQGESVSNEAQQFATINKWEIMLDFIPISPTPYARAFCEA